MADKKTLEVLRTIDKLPVDVAKQEALNILNQMKHSNRENHERLKRDVSATNSAKHIAGIMWRTILAGDGLRTVNSTWNAQ